MLKNLFTKSSIIKFVVFCLILAFYGSVLAHKISLPAADDLPRQIKIGETLLQGNFNILYQNIYSYTEPDHLFYNHHWFSGVLFYLLFQVLGWSGLVVFKIAVFLVAFSLVFLTALKKANFWLVALCSLPAVVILLERTGLRPEVFSYLFVALYLYLLVDLDDHPERKRVYWLIPLQLLWVNMHVFFSIGIMMTAGFLFEKIVLNWKQLKTNALVRKLFFVFLGVVAVSFLNPRGLSGVLYRYPAKFPILISENVSILSYVRGETLFEDPSLPIFFVSVALLAVSFFLALRRKQKPIFFFLASAATAALGFHILRGLSLFGFVFLPAICTNLNGYFLQIKDRLVHEAPRFARFSKKAGIVGLVIVYVLLIYPGWSLQTRYKQRGFGLAPWSEASAKFFKEQGLHGPIFNDADIGSYLIYYLYPQEQVFADNRFGDAYSPEFFGDTLLPLLGDEDKWQATLKKYDFNTIFYYHYDGAPNGRHFIYTRIHDPAWALIYADPFAVILVRDVPANKEVIAKFRITPENVEEKLSYLTNSSSSGDQTAAADLFNLLGRQELVRRTFLNVLVRNPDRGRIWLLLGQMALDENTEEGTVLAARLIEKAISVGRGTAEAYGLLGATYNRMHQTDKAIELLRRSLKINPDLGGPVELLRSLTKFQIQ